MNSVRFKWTSTLTGTTGVALRRILGTLITVLMLGLGGCTSGPFFKRDQVANDEFLATDARLRVVTNSEPGKYSRHGAVDPQRIVCTEPSPDVATTVANSFGASLGVFGKGSGSVSAQQVEGLAQLAERTSSIQLLRDKMYQTCLAYSNGAISGTTYSLIMSRLDDTIVTLLLGETAGGAFGRSQAAIGGKADSKAQAKVSGLPSEVANLGEVSKKLAATNHKLDGLNNDLAALRATSPAEGKEEELQANIDAKEKEVSAARIERDALLQAVQSSSEALAEASGEISKLEAGGGLDRTADPRVAEILAGMQASFLLGDFSKDFVSACLVEFAQNEDVERVNTGQLDSMIGLLDAIDSSKRNLDSLRRSGADTDTDDLENDIRLAERNFNSLLSSWKTSSQTLFSEALSGWHDGDVDLVNVIAAGQLSRRSMLANYCHENLKPVLTDASLRLHEYRLEKIKLETNVALSRDQQRFHDSRLADTEALQAALDSCKERFKKDEEEKLRNECYDAFLSR